MLTIAITGGIGSGKSTVTKYLISLGFVVIDSDEIAREMTSAGGEAIPYIREYFGSSYILKDGSMDRSAIRNLVYANPEAMKILEEGTTNVVIEKIEKIKSDAAKAGYKAIFFDIPLLFEKNQEENYDMVWVVTADYNIRCQRIILRDNIDRNLITRIMNKQEKEAVKLNKADIVIQNNGTLEELHSSIKDALIDCSLL